MRRLTIVLTTAAVLTLAAPVGAVGPPAADQSPAEGMFAHQHFVITGNGCVDIDRVLFEPDTRGLHRGTSASGHDRGPEHVFPGLGCADFGD